jgi:hypothetical protein
MLMSQRKTEYKTVLNILYPIRMPPTTLAVDSLNDRHQSCASRIHMSPPVGSSVNNLQEGSTASIVKDRIVTAIPNCPDQSANTNSDSRSRNFVYPVQPITKHVLNISRGRHIECKLNNSPNKSTQFAFNKEMINSLFLITKGALLAPSPVSFGKIVFCQDLFSV